MISERWGGAAVELSTRDPITRDAIHEFLRYQITEHFQVSLEGVNLTDEYRYRWTDIDTRRNYENNHFGRTFLIGARFEM